MLKASWDIIKKRIHLPICNFPSAAIFKSLLCAHARCWRYCACGWAEPPWCHKQCIHTFLLLYTDPSQSGTMTIKYWEAKQNGTIVFRSLRIFRVRLLFGCMWGSDWLHAGCQEISICSNRGGSHGMYITFASGKVNKAEPTLALNPRGDVTRNPKQGYQWPSKRTCVRQKLFFKKHHLKHGHPS